MKACSGSPETCHCDACARLWCEACGHMLERDGACSACAELTEIRAEAAYLYGADLPEVP